MVENEIRRGAFYMRPRKVALPQAGTGGYGIRPYEKVYADTIILLRQTALCRIRPRRSALS